MRLELIRVSIQDRCHAVSVKRLEMVRWANVDGYMRLMLIESTIAGYVAKAVHHASRYYALTWRQQRRDYVTLTHARHHVRALFKCHHSRERSSGQS